MASAQPVHLQGPNLGTTGIGVVEIQLRASGGDGTYSWSLVSGNGDLPPGVALRTDVPSWFSPDAAAGLIGVATTAGQYPFTLRATSAGQNTDLEYTLTISPLRAQDSWELPYAFVGVPYSFGLTAVKVGAVGPVIATWASTGGLPAGMSLSSEGVLQGTPAAAGFYNVNYMLTEGADT
ncbi:MAG: putative Ig domain-containing protein, partial [Vicinamibacteria bacterium]